LRTILKESASGSYLICTGSTRPRICRYRCADEELLEIAENLEVHRHESEC
jgi:hypothetical protein